MNGNWHTETEALITVHVMETDKYKMTTGLAAWHMPLSKETVTQYAILPHVLLRGTRVHPGPERLMQAFDELYGASISGGAAKQGDSQTIQFTLQCASEAHLPEAKGLFGDAVELFAQTLYDPFLPGGAFAEKAVSTEKTLHRQRIENAMNDKIAYAGDRCVQLMFAEDPFGIPRNGYAEAVEQVDSASLYRAYRDMTGSQTLHVYVVGPMPAKETARRILDTFTRAAQAQGLTPDERTDNTGPLTRPFRSTRRSEQAELVVERLDVTQGKLNFGLSTGVAYADDGYPALLVYNGILGGFPHSKLFVNVREKASLAYYASSRLEGLKGAMFVQSGIEIDKVDRARDIILEQLEALASGDITDDELAFTRDGLTNQYLLSDDQPMTGAMLQMYGRLSGRDRTVDELLRGIQSVTRADVIEVAKGVKPEIVYFLRDREEVHHA